MTFDYKVIASCEYEILDSHNNPHDCGEPATHEVWWECQEEFSMEVCPKHFQYIKACEETPVDMY